MQNNLITIKMKRICFFSWSLMLVVLVSGLFVTGCSEDEEEDKIEHMLAEKIEFTDSIYHIYVNDSIKLEYIVSPNDATNKDVVFTSLSPKIADISSNGIVYGKSEGNTVIKVRIKDTDIAAICKVYVRNKLPKKIKLSESYTELTVNHEKQLSYSLSPENISVECNIVWSVDDINIASVDNLGCLEGHSVGETVLRASIKGTDISDSCIVKILPEYVTGISISTNEEKVLLGEKLKLIAHVIPANATNQEVIWRSLDEDIATIDSIGNLTTLNYGTATIEVESVEGGFKKQKTINVVDIDSFVTATCGVGTEGSTSTVFYSYIKLNFNTNVKQSVNIKQITLQDETGGLVDAISDIGEVTTYNRKTITKIHSGNSFNTYKAEGWKYEILYVYKGKEYNTTLVNKNKYLW